MRNITALSIGNLVFDNNNFILQEVTGLESPAVRLSRYNFPGQSGAFISNALYGERNLQIKGVINAPDGQRSTFINNRTSLINALAFIRDANNVLMPQTINISLENGQNLTTTGYIDTALQMGFPSDQSDWVDFQFTLVCPDPNLYSTLQSNFTINLAVGGGTAIPTPIPISLAAASGGLLVVNNIGSNIAYPVITLIPPLTNPFIANLTTNQFMQLNATFLAGDPNIVIDMKAQTIKQGANDISALKSLNSIFWGLLSGNNNIGFSAQAGSGQCQGSYFPSFIGV